MLAFVQSEYFFFLHIFNIKWNLPFLLFAILLSSFASWTSSEPEEFSCVISILSSWGISSISGLGSLSDCPISIVSEESPVFALSFTKSALSSECIDWIKARDKNWINK